MQVAQDAGAVCIVMVLVCYAKQISSVSFPQTHILLPGSDFTLQLHIHYAGEHPCQFIHGHKTAGYLSEGEAILLHCLNG